MLDQRTIELNRQKSLSEVRRLANDDFDGLVKSIDITASELEEEITSRIHDGFLEGDVNNAIEAINKIVFSSVLSLAEKSVNRYYDNYIDDLACYLFNEGGKYHD